MPDSKNTPPVSADGATADGRSTAARSAKPGATIVLDDVTKHYPGQEAAAVEAVSMTIPAGEIVVFVGPSGCGKTTTMKMINRLIEPSSGRILIDDVDVLGINVDQHRRNIGYVIQQTGLIPHMTIAENIGLVPRMLKWKKSEISNRVDELLEMVGLPASRYAKRYPRQLSGGQQQRIGVARALAADPPVMLMDEPFGAIDPITRERLQNEFLRLQQTIQKTIIFVTHDIDEAIKMGDRIVVLRDQSHIAQFDTPAEILSNPADDYVSDFIGAGASLKRLNLTRIRDVAMTDDNPTGLLSEPPADLLARLVASDWSAMLLLDAQRRPARWVTAPDLRRVDGIRPTTGLRATALVEAHATLSDALNELVTSNGGVAIVVDGSGAYQGVVDMETIMTAVRSLREEQSEFYMAAKHTQDDA